MLIRDTRALVMLSVLGLSVTLTTRAQQSNKQRTGDEHSAAYHKCRSQCRASAQKLQRTCMSKPGAVKAKCDTAAKEASHKCRTKCTE